MVKWTKDEEEQILQGWPVKEHRDAIAEELGRSKAACATRYRKLIKETPAKDLTGDAYVEKVQQMKEEVVEEISEKITEIIEQNEAELAATNGKLKEVKEELKEEQVNNVAETVEILSTKKDYKYTVRIVALLTILGCSYLGWYLYA